MDILVQLSSQGLLISLFWSVVGLEIVAVVAEQIVNLWPLSYKLITFDFLYSSLCITVRCLYFHSFFTHGLIKNHKMTSTQLMG